MSRRLWIVLVVVCGALGSGVLVAQILSPDDGASSSSPGPGDLGGSKTPSQGAPEATSSPGTGTQETTTTMGPADGGDRSPPLHDDALLGAPFGSSDAESVIGTVIDASSGSVGSDQTQRAKDSGLPVFGGCHGPSGDGPAEIRSVVVDSEDVGIRLYIADGVFLGYEVSGDDERYRTTEGVGLGSTEEELVEAYGSRLTLEPGLDAKERWAWLDVPGAMAPTRFDYIEGSPVHRVTVGGRCN